LPFYFLLDGNMMQETMIGDGEFTCSDKQEGRMKNAEFTEIGFQRLTPPISTERLRFKPLQAVEW
jgi:hypothetical protein